MASNTQNIEIDNKMNDIKKQLSQLPGMTSIPERMHLYQYASHEYSGEGEIVDLGCWLGSSTISLGMGLANNDRVKVKENRIHSFDLFKWTPAMAKHPSIVGTSMEGKYQQGESFLDEYLKRVESWGLFIDANQSDLTQTHWTGDSKIDYLFIDAMKSWSLIENIMKGFFPFLVPERSLIHHNDWINTLQYEIHLLMYRLRDCFEPIAQVKNAMIFKLKHPVSDDILNDSYSSESFSEQEIDSAFNYALTISSIPETHPSIAAAKVKCLIDIGKLEKAQLEFNLAKLKKDTVSKPGFNYDRMFERLERLLSKK